PRSTTSWRACARPQQGNIMSFTRVEFGPLAALSTPPASSPSSPPSLVSTGLQVGQTPPAAAPADPLAGTAASQVQVRTSAKGAFVNMAGGAAIERGVTSINMGELPNGEVGILATANRVAAYACRRPSP